MNESNWISMIERLAQSTLPVQALASGFGYVVGIIFMLIGLKKLQRIADFRARSSSNIPIIVPFAYFIGGAILIFFPEAVKIASTTAFGTGNILAYAKINRASYLGAMIIIIQTIGVIWFIRGTVLLVNASNPGIQHGPKGFAFLISGILAINFEGTVSLINTAMQYVGSYTMAFKGSLGY
jgi:hypothetical protein